MRELAQAGDLVLIYGADAAETAVNDRRQALGFLEIDPVAITDRERLSAEGLKRKVTNGWENRWTYAVPVSRAWRVMRRIEVKHLAPDTYVRSTARVIASRGELLTPNEAENTLKLPVKPVSVFGEMPIPETEGHEFSLRSVFKPTQGLTQHLGRVVSITRTGSIFCTCFEWMELSDNCLGVP